MEPPSLRDSLAIYAPFEEDRRRSTRNFPSRHTRCLGPVRCPRVSDVSVLVLLVVSLSTSSIATTPDTAKDILAAAKAVNDYALNQIVSTPYNPARGGGCQWTRSTFMMGLVEYYAASEWMQAPDPRARDFLMNWGEAFQYQLCRAGPCTSWCGPCSPTNSSLGPALGCGDNQLCGAVYMELYKQGLDRPVPRSSSTLYASATEFDAEIALGKKADGTWHVIDTVYMAMAPLSRLGALTGKQKYFDKQWANWCSTVFGPLSASTITTAVAVDDGGKLWNATDRLFHRDQTKLGTNTYWGRGNGWAMLGLVDALRWGNATVAATGDRGVHQGDPHWSRYNAVYKTFAARLIELQWADGAWRSSLLQSDLFPTPETSATACFTHGLAYGVNAGLLERDRFVPPVMKAWDFLTRMAMRKDARGRLGYCQPPGGGPAHASSGFGSNSTSDYCVGMMLMASAQVAEMVGKEAQRAQDY